MVVELEVNEWPFCINDYDSDCLVFDPPYNAGLYNTIPQKGKLKSLIVFGSNFYIAEIITNALRKAWTYRFMIVWDTVTSWYVPGRPLMRDNVLLVFGDFVYCAENDIVNDRIYRRSVNVKNPRGNYVSIPKFGAHLSSVFVKCRASMGKSHAHQKPVELVAAVLGAVMADSIIDPFCGSGAIGAAAKSIGARRYYGADIVPDNVISAQNFIAEFNIIKHDNCENYELFTYGDAL